MTVRREKLLFASGRKSSLVEAGSPPVTPTIKGDPMPFSRSTRP